MASSPLVANEVPTGTTGSDGLAVFTFAADIDKVNHRLVVDRLEQGNTIDYNITATRQITFVAGSCPVVGAKVWLFNGVAGVQSATSLPSWPTAGQVINDAAVELGLIAADIADPFASTNALIVQLIRLLKKGGRELAKWRDWKHLVKEFSFVTVSGTNAYALPSDWRSQVDDTEWNRTSRLPMRLVDGQQWQALSARVVVPTVTIFFRIWQGQIFLLQPPDGQTVAFEYNSSGWVKPAGATFPTSDAPSAASDIVCFDSSLIVSRLKMDFRRAKKQDSQSEQDDYETALNNAENEDAQGETIYLGSGGRRGKRKINRWNLPDTIT